VPSPRWWRLFNPHSNRCVAVALDHGLTGEPAEFRGLERFLDSVAAVSAAEPDAFLVSAGQAKRLAEASIRLPALIVRIDATNAYQRPTPQRIFDRLLDDACAVALRADAAAVIVNLLWVPQHEEATAESVQAILGVRSACEQYALPLIVEVMVLRAGPNGTLQPGARLEELKGLVRLAVELGADIIKVTPPDEREAFGELCELAGVPLLVLGGARGDERAVLEHTATLVQYGASGVIFGRNVFQHPNPPGMVRALRSIVHEHAPVEKALQHLSELSDAGVGE
jgi:class I fructose-bisphosphate aldolase